jgi:hypothetical protein
MSHIHARRTAACAAVSTAGLLMLTSCVTEGRDPTASSYEVARSVTRLIVDARAGSVVVEAGDGPISVTETYGPAGDNPRTSHQVEGTTLRITDTGCRRPGRCQVEFRVRVPATTAADITTRAGAVRLTGLDGEVAVVNQTGIVEASGLASARVSASTRTGSISLGFSRPPIAVKASTALGSVVVKVPPTKAYAVDVSTLLGGSEILVPRDPASPHKISLRTDLGGVRVEGS